MKKPLLITFLLTSAIASAQMTSANEPTIGENVDLFVIDSFATNYSGVTGAAVTWDYTNTGGYNGTTQTVEVLDPSTEVFVDSFPGATKVISIGGTIKTYFSSTASDRTSQGFHMDEASLGDVLAMYSNDELIVANYPMSYGSGTVTDSYDGNLSLTFNGFPVYESLTGSADALIDGEGTLIYPDGTSATGVIRYHSYDVANTTLPIVGAVDVIRDQYEYYDYANQNLPVFMHVTITIVQSGGTTPISETNLVLSKVDGIANASVNGIEVVDFTVAPNPVNDKVVVYGELSSNAQATLTDQSGRVLETLNVANGQSIDMSNYANGMYLITIKDSGATTTKTIIKK